MRRKELQGSYGHPKVSFASPICCWWNPGKESGSFNPHQSMRLPPATAEVEPNSGRSIYDILGTALSTQKKNRGALVDYRFLARPLGSLALGIACLLISAGAWAQAYPNRPIKLVIPSGLGTAGDVLGRSLAVSLTESTGIKFTFESLDGQDGTIAADIVAKAAPDGYTLLFGNELTHVINPLRAKSFPYSPLEDFTPIAIFSEDRYVLVANPSVPAANVPELIAYAKKANPQLTFGSYNPGTTSQVAGAAFNAMAGIEMKHEGFPTVGPAMNALADNRVQVMFATLRAAKQHLDKGRIKVLGIAGPAFSELPNVAPVSDAVPGFETKGWFAVFAPAKLPPEIQKFLNEKVNAAFTHPRLKSVLDRMAGTSVAPRSPEELAALIAQDAAKRGPLIKAAKMEE
jgi:tripartite-type tricarboxylate transporter receptor subunit TctC